jgi:hypothetical protein
MKTQCQREEEVIRARKEGLLAGEAKSATVNVAALREHVAACNVCQEVLFIAELFERYQSELAAQTHLPEADLVWWKAQLRARREAVRRAEAPVVMAERVAWIVGALSATALAAWQWPAIQGWINLSNHAQNAGAHPGAWITPFVAVLAGTLVLAGVGLYLIGSEK